LVLVQKYEAPAAGLALPFGIAAGFTTAERRCRDLAIACDGLPLEGREGVKMGQDADQGLETGDLVLLGAPFRQANGLVKMLSHVLEHSRPST